MPKGIFDCYDWHVYWIKWVMAWDTANHPTVHRRALRQGIIWPKMSVMQYRESLF